LVSLCALGSLAAPALADSPISHHEQTLPNGLKVILHEDHRRPWVAVRVTYHVGALHERPGEFGLAHLLQYLMFGGSENMDPYGPGYFFSRMPAFKINGTASFDLTDYHEVLQSVNLPLALWLESDRMRYLFPAVRGQDFENVRLYVMN